MTLFCRHRALTPTHPERRCQSLRCRELLGSQPLHHRRRSQTSARYIAAALRAALSRKPAPPPLSPGPASGTPRGALGRQPSRRDSRRGLSFPSPPGTARRSAAQRTRRAQRAMERSRAAVRLLLLFLACGSAAAGYVGLGWAAGLPGEHRPHPEVCESSERAPPAGRVPISGLTHLSCSVFCRPTFLVTAPWNIRPGANVTVGVALLPGSPPQVTVRGALLRDNQTVLSREMVFERGRGLTPAFSHGILFL